MQTLTHRLTGTVLKYDGLIDNFTMQLTVLEQCNGKYPEGTELKVSLNNLPFYKATPNKPKEYFVLWRNAKGELKQFDTDSEEDALLMELRRDGETYRDTRIAAKRRVFNWLISKGLFSI